MTIWIDDATELRVNINAPYKGFSKLNTPEIRARANVVEIAEPTPPADYSDDLYYRTESQESPYVIYTKKSDEQIAAVRWSKIKAKRDELTNNGGCKVEVSTGLFFWFHSDAYSKTQQLGLETEAMKLLFSSGDMTTPLSAEPWKTMNGEKVTMTAALALKVATAQKVRDGVIFAHAEALNLDPAADIDAGWPERYEAAPL